MKSSLAPTSFNVLSKNRCGGLPTMQDLRGAVVIQHVREGAESFGFNAETGIYEDLMQAGIVDPTKVSRLALQYAASAAGLFMTTEAMIAEKPKKRKTSASDIPLEEME